MIINNSAHKLYLSNKLKYNNIIKYIMSEINKNSKNVNLNSFNSILSFILMLIINIKQMFKNIFLFIFYFFLSQNLFSKSINFEGLSKLI